MARRIGLAITYLVIMVALVALIVWLSLQVGLVLAGLLIFVVPGLLVAAIKVLIAPEAAPLTSDEIRQSEERRKARFEALVDAYRRFSNPDFTLEEYLDFRWHGATGNQKVRSMIDQEKSVFGDKWGDFVHGN